MSDQELLAGTAVEPDVDPDRELADGLKRIARIFDEGHPNRVVLETAAFRLELVAKDAEDRR